jgi:hypothetical protein
MRAAVPSSGYPPGPALVRCCPLLAGVGAPHGPHRRVARAGCHSRPRAGPGRLDAAGGAERPSSRNPGRPAADLRGGDRRAADIPGRGCAAWKKRIRKTDRNSQQMDGDGVRFWDIKNLGNGTAARFRVCWAVDGREHCRRPRRSGIASSGPRRRRRSLEASHGTAGPCQDETGRLVVLQSGHDVPSA